jgi:dimethylargininase
MPKNLVALTHAPSPQMEGCELTFVERATIDFPRALQQHEAYCRLLRDCGAEVHLLSTNGDQPDCVFVEDTAVVLDEIAVVGSMGAKSRRPETEAIARELGKFREVERIELPGTLEGGDVLRVGRQLLVGVSSRTNDSGLRCFAEIVGRFGYEIIPVPVHNCLHLKTACTALPDQTLLVNPAWVGMEALRSYECICIPDREPWGANVALVNEIVCLSTEHKLTAEMISKRGFEVRTVDLSEFAKAEGGITCLSILFANPVS